MTASGYVGVFPGRDGALAAAVVVGAAGAALVGAHAAAGGAALLPDVGAITADLHLSAVAAPAPAAVPTAPAAPRVSPVPMSAASAVDLASASTGGASAASTSAASTSAASTSAASTSGTVDALSKATTRARSAAKVETAIDRFQAMSGSTSLENMCELAVEKAYGTSGRYSSALVDWQTGPQHRDWQNAPRGALVFYDTSSDGHVAVSLGDGRVISTSAHGQVGIVPIGYFSSPLGWKPSPF